MENSLGGGTQPPRSDKEKMIRGSAWMTAGSVFSRILGAIYVIPWRIWLGAAFLTANALFTKGYQIYSLFLIISTAGVPGAVSKQVARYNAAFLSRDICHVHYGDPVLWGNVVASAIARSRGCPDDSGFPLVGMATVADSIVEPDSGLFPRL